MPPINFKFQISNFKFRGGFTLIELLVSIGLLAVLSAGVISYIGRGSQEYARDSRRRADLEAIRSALELYRNDQGGYPNGTASLTPNYIQAVPADPRTAVAYPYTPAGCVAGRCSTYNLCANLEKTTATCPTDYVVTNP